MNSGEKLVQVRYDDTQIEDYYVEEIQDLKTPRRKLGNRSVYNTNLEFNDHLVARCTQLTLRDKMELYLAGVDPKYLFHVGNNGEGPQYIVRSSFCKDQFDPLATVDDTDCLFHV